MTRPALLSLGSINADFQMRAPGEVGEAEMLVVEDFRRLPGGKAANRAYLARRFGHPASLFGHIGADDLAAQALGALQQEGVDVSGVERLERAGTAVSVVIVPPTGKKHVFLAPNANADWDDAETTRMEQAVRQADPASVLAVDYEAPPPVVARAVEAAARRGVRVVIDPSPGEAADRAVLAKAFALAPNVSEAEALVGIRTTGRASATAAARALAGLGARVACLKLEDGGAIMAEGGALHLISPPEVEPVDATGAGDAFTGALAIGLLEGRPPLEAACLAVAAASVAVTAYGSQLQVMTPGRIEPLARALRDRVQPLQGD